MNIGFDIRTLSFRKGGISQYAYGLLKSLIRLDQKNQYYLFGYTKSGFEWDNFRGNVQEIVLRLPQRHGGRAFWEMALVPFAARRWNLDVWFSPVFFVPKFIRIPRVVAIHDLIFMNFYDPESRYSRDLQAKVAYAIKHAAKIVVTSHYTMEDLCKAFPLDRGKVAVIHLAADERFHPIEKSLVPAVLKRYGIDFPYLLFVGEISQRKNLSHLLKALRLLKQDDRLSGRKLVVVGKRTTDTDQILHEVLGLKLSEDVFFTGYVADEDLPFIYNGADVFVFPSLYEGFGIPPLEAMQCGTPVVASNATSIPEVVGEGALLFDPNDPADMAERIDEVVNGKVDVGALRARAKHQVEKFTWVSAASRTMDIFDALRP